jgi:hypothetical protein
MLGRQELLIRPRGIVGARSPVGIAGLRAEQKGHEEHEGHEEKQQKNCLAVLRVLRAFVLNGQ